MKAILKYAAIALVLPAMVGNQRATAQSQQTLDSIVAKHRLVGLTVATYDNGTVKVYNSGLQDLDRKISVSDSSIFRVASVSKLVTTTALMTLFDQKKFNLDDDISRYLGFKLRNPNFPDVPITIRMILSHTSTINDSEGYGSFLVDTYKSKESLPQLSDLLVEGGKYYTPDVWLNKKPGEYFTYCNINFGVAGTLIERISGVRFDQYVAQTVLKPLGIKGGYNVAELPNINNLGPIYRDDSVMAATVDRFNGVKPQQRDLSRYVMGSNGFIYGPQGGMRISSSDLMKILALHLNEGKLYGKRILSKKAVKLMQQPSWRYNGSNGDSYHDLFQSWGLGEQVITASPKGDLIYPNKVLYGHAGFAYGLVSGLYFDPKTKKGVVFITNGSYKPFANGKASAYYAVEEDVFSFVQPLLGK